MREDQNTPLKSSGDFEVALQHPLALEPINGQDTKTDSRPNSTAKAIVASDVRATDFDHELADREALKLPEKVLLGKRPAEELTTEQVQQTKRIRKIESQGWRWFTSHFM